MILVAAGFVMSIVKPAAAVLAIGAAVRGLIIKVDQSLKERNGVGYVVESIMLTRAEMDILDQDGRLEGQNDWPLRLTYAEKGWLYHTLATEADVIAFREEVVDLLLLAAERSEKFDKSRSMPMTAEAFQEAFQEAVQRRAEAEANGQAADVPVEEPPPPSRWSRFRGWVSRKWRAVCQLFYDLDVKLGHFLGGGSGRGTGGSPGPLPFPSG